MSKLMKALSKEYDEYCKPFMAVHKLQLLTQGNKSIATHHGELGRIVRGMGQTMATTDPQILNAYVHSLTDSRIRQKLIADITSEKHEREPYKLEQLTEKARRSESVLEMDRARNAVAIAAAAQSTRTPSSGPPRSTSYKPNNPDPNGPPMWCDIHEASTHNTSNCREVNRSNCRYCMAPMAPGQYAGHIKARECDARRCFQCDRLGHLAHQCKQAQNRFQNTRVNRPHPYVSNQQPATPRSGNPTIQSQLRPTNNTRPSHFNRQGVKTTVAAVSVEPNDIDDTGNTIESIQTPIQTQPLAESDE